MGMVFVVVQEPSGDLPECGDRIRKRVHANIVSLEGFDEALGDAIRFRALNGSEARDEIESGREGPGLVCRVDAAIVGKPFERVRSLDGGEPALNGLQHHVANHAAADAGVGDRMPSNDLAVVSIDDEGQACHRSSRRSRIRLSTIAGSSA